MKTCQVSVQLETLKKVFGENVALDIDSFTINSGDVLGSLTTPTRKGYTFTGWKALPYTPIEYLESTGIQYIDTGILPSQTLMIFQMEKL